MEEVTNKIITEETEPSITICTTCNPSLQGHTRKEISNKIITFSSLWNMAELRHEKFWLKSGLFNYGL
jgi:uncharacterized protein with PIN domain